MRAFALDEFGKPGSIHDVPIPDPNAGQVRVKVRAAGINPYDNWVLAGAMKERMEHHFPLIPADDLAGTVDAVGDGVEQWQVGDEVFGRTGKATVGHGSLAEWVTASAGTVARRPASLDPEFAAALPLTGVSALMCVEPMNLKRGDVVVILGAAGGVGGYSIQLAKQAGATVIACTREVNAAYVRGLGADQVVDYSTQDVAGTVSKAYPGGIAGIIHASGDVESLEKLAAIVRKGGHISSMRGGAKADELALRGLTGTNVVTGVTTTRLEKLAAMVESGELKRPEIKLFKLEQSGEAFAEIATGHARGKLVIVP